jgi:hypothetical protein
MAAAHDSVSSSSRRTAAEFSPGGVLTGLSSELRASRGEAEDSPEWMTSEEVGEAALYLCTQTGAAMTDELAMRRFAAEPWR